MHFLSAQETASAAHYQTLLPNKCKQTNRGVFDSKFVTVCATGDKDKEIVMQGY